MRAMGILDRFVGAGVKPITLEMRTSSIEKRYAAAEGEVQEPYRVPPKELEIIYVREGMIYQWINKFSETVLASNYRIVTSSKREEVLMLEFLNKIDFRALLRRTIRNEMIYGNAWWEVIKSTNGKIANVALLDSKFMDVARDNMGKPVLDDSGNPVYYVQYVSYNYDMSKIPKERRVQQTPKFTYQSGQGIKMYPDEIIQFQYNEIGESCLGIGLIEPIYNLVLVKQNTEQGYAEAVQRTAFPRIWVQVGDESHLPTQEEIDHVWSMLSDLEVKNQFVSPYYYKPTILEAKKTEKLALNLNYFIDQIVAGLGGPKPFITGSGEDTNRATLTDQKLFFERSIKETQEELSDKIEKDLFSILAHQWHFRRTPKLEWEEVSSESLDNKAERIVRYAKGGLLFVDKNIRDFIRSIERLPEEGQDAVPVTFKESGESESGEE